MSNLAQDTNNRSGAEFRIEPNDHQPEWVVDDHGNTWGVILQGDGNKGHDDAWRLHFTTVAASQGWYTHIPFASIRDARHYAKACLPGQPGLVPFDWKHLNVCRNSAPAREREVLGG